MPKWLIILSAGRLVPHQNQRVRGTQNGIQLSQHPQLTPVISFNTAGLPQSQGHHGTPNILHRSTKSLRQSKRRWRLTQVRFQRICHRPCGCPSGVGHIRHSPCTTALPILPLLTKPIDSSQSTVIGDHEQSVDPDSVSWLVSFAGLVFVIDLLSFGLLD